jgi:alanyl aminopeptidase
MRVTLPLLMLLPALAISATRTPPELRLDGKVRPVRYDLHLTLDPTKDDFDGIIDIALDIREATTLFWLNSAGLTINEANLKTAGNTYKGTPVPGGEDFVGIEWPGTLPAGPAALRIAYRGKVNKAARDGIFVVTQGGASYLVTQFESMSARKAFPCFDEPGFKVPWRLTLDIPAEQLAFSNTPVASETTDGGGTRTVRFVETKPLPSYLVAFAVGRSKPWTSASSAARIRRSVFWCRKGEKTRPGMLRKSFRGFSRG